MATVSEADITVGVDGGTVNLEWNVVVFQNMAPVLLVLQRAVSGNPRRSIQTTTSPETRCSQFVCFFIFCIIPENACIWTM